MAKELLFSVTRKDLSVDYFSGTGSGGQYRNKHQNCVRLRHAASGAIATGQSNRSREANTKEAFQGLRDNPKFKLWFAARVQEAVTGKSIEKRVDEQLEEGNLKIEVRGPQGWQAYGGAA